MRPSSLDVWRKGLLEALGQLCAVLGLMCLLITPIVGYDIFLFLKTPLSPRAATTLYFKPGSSLRRIANDLQKHGVVSSAFLTRVCAHTLLQGPPIKAGEYAFNAPLTPAEVLEKLRRGDVVVHAFQVIEGLESALALEKFMGEASLEGPLTLADLPEGSLLPDTYHFQRPETKAHLAKRMQKARAQLIAALWKKRPQDFPLKSPQEVVILASLVEKETPLARERPHVAAVFLNRLKLGMPLQCDATQRYGLWQKRGAPLAGALTRTDLQEDTPFNTYLHKGLPPTPICHPGRASLTAVLHPAPTKDLYFVADGTGGHVFSQTYGEHKTHHQAWRNMRSTSTFKN